MPKWKKATAKQATTMVGATATPLNSNTSRTCSRDPADPRRRSTQTRVSRPASTAPSSSSTDRFASTRPTLTPGFQPSGEPRARMMKVASPTMKRQRGQRQRDALAEQEIAELSEPGRSRFRNDVRRGRGA